jgi:hypothetical protein
VGSKNIFIYAIIKVVVIPSEFFDKNEKSHPDENKIKN